jgi:hypothetical protein
VTRVNSDLSLLTGESAGELMAAVLSTTGGEVLRWSARQVDHRPGRRTTVSYAARVRWPDGTVTDETFGACSGALPAGVARLTDGSTTVGMWRFPLDPDLPALAAACDQERMRLLAAELGLREHGTETVRLRVRAYRPRRRAVVEVRTRRGIVFVKVVRPGDARTLHERHRVALDAGCPVPAPLGWTDTGMVVLGGLPGRTLRELLIDPTVGPERIALDPDAVPDVLDTLPDALADGERRRTWGQRAPHYAEVVAAAVPELGDRARAVAAAAHHDAPQGPDQAVHGDFYETQFMVRGGRVSGLLDIDTAGRGERLDDAACLLAHLSVLTQLQPARSGVIDTLGLRLHRRFCRDLDPSALAVRAAAVTLSLATGPHRVQEPDWPARTAERLALAERWLDCADAPSDAARHEAAGADRSA